MKNYLWILFAILFISGCKPSPPQPPHRNVCVLNSSDNDFTGVAKADGDTVSFDEKEIDAHGARLFSVPIDVCNVHVFDSDGKVISSVFRYDFTKLDSNKTLYFDATEEMPYAAAHGNFLYKWTDYLVKPFKYDSSRKATAENCGLISFEVGKPFEFRDDLALEPAEMSKELGNLPFNWTLIELPSKNMSEQEKVAYVENFFKEMGTRAFE